MAETLFLEILTRCYKRPTMLAKNQDSLRAQVFGDWVQTLLVDDQGVGINETHERMARYAPQLVGDYIWILDDDDECIRPTLFAELYDIAFYHNPQVIMIRMDHGPRGILPDEKNWGYAPQLGHVGVSAYVVRRDVWQAHARAWTPGVYHSDYNFIAAIFADNPFVIWHNVIGSRVQQIGLGRAE